jgi:hypothetical protein
LSSAPVAIKVVDSTFGIFTRNQAGFGPAILQNFVSQVEQPVNAITDAAHPGQVVILWGTGLGPIAGDDSNIPPVGNLPVTVEVWVGGKAAVVQYAGRSSQFPAIDQINFVVPPGVVGCYVPVVVVVNGVVSNYVTIAITENGAYCSDFQTFLPGELETIVQNGQGGVGFVKLDRFRGTLETSQGSMPVLIDNADGEFISYTAQQIVSMTPKRDAIAPLGGCISNRGLTEGDGRVDPIQGSPLSAGAELELVGPEGRAAVPPNGSSYEAGVGGGFGGDALPEFYAPGILTLRGGSPADDIGMFEASVDLPASPQWIGQATFNTVRRDQDLTIQWSGIDPDTEYLVISVQSVNNEIGVAGFIFCSADPAAGSFTVPQRAMGTLPPSSPWDGEGDATGVLSVSGDSRSSSGKIEATGLTTGRLYYSNRAVRTTVIE